MSKKTKSTKVVNVRGTSAMSRERWRFYSGFCWKIQPDLDEPGKKIIEKGLATVLRSKTLPTQYFGAQSNS
jgi:hypothetical protein